MSQFDRMARATAVAAAIAIGVLGSTVATSAQTAAPSAKAKAADAAQDPAAQKKQAGEQARASLESGVKSHSAGKHQLAADQLSSALRGGLQSNDMARALYVRGLSYKALSKPGLAISDLTSALWLKNGLSESDRQSATAERADAYRLAGLSDAGLGAERAVVSNPNPAAAVASAPTTTPAPAIAPAPVAIAANVPPATGGQQIAVPTRPATATSTWSSTTGTVTRQAPDSEAAQDAARARRLAATPVETNGMDAAVLGRSVNAPTPVSPEVTPSLAPQPITAAPAAPTADAPTLSALPSEASSPSATTSDPLASVPSTVSGFFSNLFSGGGQSNATATTTAAPVAVAAAAPPFTTSSTSALAQPSAATAAPPVIPVAPAAKQAKTGGKYKLHIAAVRSRAEAEALAQQLSSKHGGDLAQRAPTVDEAVIGSMGTFYRVRVGSYANPDEPRGVCNKLRTSGFDCLVVTN